MIFFAQLSFKGFPFRFLDYCLFEKFGATVSSLMAAYTWMLSNIDSDYDGMDLKSGNESVRSENPLVSSRMGGRSTKPFTICIKP